MTNDIQIYLLKGSSQIGPFALDDVKQRASEGMVSHGDLAWYDGLQEWVALGTIRGVFTTPPIMPTPTPAVGSYALILPRDDDMTISRIADYERISGIFWIILAVVQICTVIGVIAGVWNLFAGMSRLKMVPHIRARNPSVPQAYRNGLTMLIVITVINFVLGGMIGLAFVAFDFFIRDLVLKHEALFDGSSSRIAV